MTIREPGPLRVSGERVRGRDHGSADARTGRDYPSPRLRRINGHAGPRITDDGQVDRSARRAKAGLKCGPRLVTATAAPVVLPRVLDPYVADLLELRPADRRHVG